MGYSSKPAIFASLTSALLPVRENQSKIPYDLAEAMQALGEKDLAEIPLLRISNAVRLT
jgi:hypothetical protein